MRTLTQIKNDIEANQAEYRRIGSLNNGVIRGAIDTNELQKTIKADMVEYNSRSKRDHYEGGIIVSGRA